MSRVDACSDRSSAARANDRRLSSAPCRSTAAARGADRRRLRHQRRRGARRARRMRARWWVEVLLIVWLAGCTTRSPTSRPCACTPRSRTPAACCSLEQTLHIDPERSLDRWLAPHHTLALVVSDYYDNAHFVVTLGLLGWLWWRARGPLPAAAQHAGAGNLIAFVVFWRYPGRAAADARRLHRRRRRDAARSAPGTAARSPPTPTSSRRCPRCTWPGPRGARWRCGRLTSARGCARCAAYPFVTAFAVLATGNHFVLDILAGLATFALASRCSRSARERARTLALRGAVRGLPSRPARAEDGLAARIACHKVVTKS